MRLTCVALAFKEKLLAPAGKSGPGQDLGCCGVSRVWGHILRDSSSTDVQLLAGNLGNFCLEHLAWGSSPILSSSAPQPEAQPGIVCHRSMHLPMWKNVITTRARLFFPLEPPLLCW